MTAVLKRASKSPKGYVGSAVMLNAKLKKGVNLMHVMYPYPPKSCRH